MLSKYEKWQILYFNEYGDVDEIPLTSSMTFRFNLNHAIQIIHMRV